MGLLAGQLCSRILAPWKIRSAVELPSNAPILSQREWDDSWQKLGKAWNRTMRNAQAPVHAAEVEKAFQPVQPKPGDHHWNPYPDYWNLVQAARGPVKAILTGFLMGPVFAVGVLGTAAALGAISIVA